MTSSPTSSLGIEKQGQGDNINAWWFNLNRALDAIDDALAAEVALSTTGGDSALTNVSYLTDQGRCPIIRIGSGETIVSNVRVTTTRARVYFVTNETASGSFTVQFGGDTSNLVTIPRGSGAYVRVRADATTSFAGPLIVLSTGKIDTTSVSGLLVAANNLSDLANAATARGNLGVAIGSQVQAWDAQLDSLSSASANGVSLVTAASYAAMKALLDLEIGTDVQAWNAQLDSLSSASANGVSLVTAADYAAMRTLLSLLYASAAEQVTGTATDKVVAPGTQHRHKSAVKAHGRVASDGTLQSGSYGVTSVGAPSGGEYIVTLSAAMADTNYTIACGPRQAGVVAFGTVIDASSFTVTTRNSGNSAVVTAAFWFEVCGTLA